MNKIKYCKFCDKEKPEEDFCKSGGFIKNICRDCQNKKQKQIYQNSKRTKQLEQEIEILNNRIEKAINFLKENACIDEDMEYFCDDLRYDDCKTLLEILRGDDKKVSENGVSNIAYFRTDGGGSKLYTQEYVDEKDKEIKRLNNIMNKFEKWLDTVPNYFMDTRSNNTGVYIQKGMQQMIDMSKNKLQELKESDEA